MFLFQTADNVDIIHVFLQVTCQYVQVVFGNSKAAVTEYLLERDHRAAHGDPFLCKGMAETMHARFVDAPIVTIIPKCVVAAASGELFPVGGAEEPIVRVALAVFQELLEYLHNVLIQRDTQGLAVLGDRHIDNVVVKIQVFDLDIDHAVLTDASREQEIHNHPTAVCGKVAAADIGLFQQLFEFCIGVCFDRLLVRLGMEISK